METGNYTSGGYVVGMPINDSRVPARLWSKVSLVTRSALGECWEWIGCRTEHGYAKYWDAGRNHGTGHKFFWEHLVGPVGDGLELDHLCRNRACVNPDHLEPVTHAENQARSPLIAEAFSARVAQQKAITHCPSGHEYTDENTRRDKRGCRVCRTCQRAAQAAWAENNRETLRLGAERRRLADPETHRARCRASYHKKTARLRAGSDV